MDDPFVTADRFRAAIQAALTNPRRTSTVPTGLAIHELLSKKTRQKYADGSAATPTRRARRAAGRLRSPACTIRCSIRCS